MEPPICIPSPNIRSQSQASFEQDYIAGKYGAVPFIGDLSRLLGKK